MKRIKINTTYDPAIQGDKAIDKELKIKQLTTLLNNCDSLANEYEKESLDKNTIEFKDKQLAKNGLVIFDRGYEIVVYRMYPGGKDFVAQYER